MTPSPAIFCLFFAIGLFSGCLIAHFFKDSLYAPLFSFYQTLFTQLKNVEVDTNALFLLTARKQLKYFLFLWFFSFTNIWRYYYRLFLTYIGLQNGLLFSFCLFMNGLPGIAGYFCFLLPHCLLFLPAYVITIVRCQQIYETVSSHYQSSSRECYPSKRQLIVCQLPSFLVAFALLLLGCLLEGYFNPSLLRLFLKL